MTVSESTGIRPDVTVPYTDNIIDESVDMISSLSPDWAVPNDATLTQSRYDFNYRIFPEELGGMTYNGHYMVININQQTASNMTKVNEKTISTPLDILSKEELSKTDALRFNIDQNFRGADQSNYGQFIARPRFTRRIQESIALYMPNAELTFNDTHDFENISLTKFGASATAGLLTFAAAGVGAFFGNAAKGARLAGVISNSLSGVTEASKIIGAPINPKVEVLYANTMQREHRFDFIFAPSSANESRNLRQIIRTLRFHAAPELRANDVKSFFWIPPAEFDITFFYRGTENLKIPRINTCALTQIDVSYSPNGTWSTFHDGYPTQIRMQLAFRETEVTHKLRILQGF